ncbi:uncharacterized protein LOC131167271 [Malania oleifera]|uniref:uncharacterized protein LOC131167271 n=1 Tax=Malania oleifera TaxID=397392 RepID=UPI0025AE0573|nr:uncharacterized protein LOC131167271 [Malania oleifera]
MARRRAKKNVKQPTSSPGRNVNDAEAKEPQVVNEEEAIKCQEIRKKEEEFRQEDERQSTAIMAIRNVEIEHLLTGLRLLRSYFNKEQLQIPVLQFFRENLPNLSIVRDGKYGQFEVQWKDKDGKISTSHADGRNIHASLLHRLSTAYPECSAAIPSFGVEFSSKAVETSLLGADSLQMRDFFLEEPSDTKMLGLQDALQTPGVTSGRLSVGMTPKTLRLPKPGEMLLSIRGSPLGVYKEDNMEAINESEEG